MARARTAHLCKAPNEQVGYPVWKAKFTNQLKRRHDIEATAIAERIWMQFFLHRLGPRQVLSKRAPR
jgi:hypothetical protein